MTTTQNDSTSLEDGGAVPRPSLWKNADFLKLWAGQTISMFGSQITPIALPLLAATVLRATPGEMALLRALEYTPAILVGLFAGVWVDRVRRRPILIGSDLGRVLLLASIPVAATFNLMRMELLYAVAFLLGVLGVCFNIAYGAYLPALVRRDQLVEGNSRLALSGSVAGIAGPGLAGTLIQFFTAPLAGALEAGSCMVSASFLGLVR